MKRIGSIFFMCLLLASCGFEPVYGKHDGSSAQPAITQVYVDPIPGRMGQLLNNSLEDVMAPAGRQGALYHLSATIDKAVTPVIIEPDGSISRYNIQLVSGYTLSRNSDGKVLQQGKIKRISSYNAAPSDFSTYVAEGDMVERSIVEIAEEYRLRVAAAIADAEALP